MLFRSKAFVIVRKGATVTAEELVEHTRGRLAKFKVPDEIVFPHELPRTPTGKVLKFELRNSN